MLYKTIVLRLLEGNPELYQHLRSTGTLLTALDQHASAFKASHQKWKDHLARERPGTDALVNSSEALELAVKELEAILSPASGKDEDEPLSLDAAMAFLRNHTPTE